jgi:hypothetical protein
MNYYVRVFCINAEVPDLASIQAWLGESGSAALIDEPDHAIEAAEAGEPGRPILDLATSEWEQVAIVYRAGKLPILAECHRDDGTTECLMRKEIAKFQELIGEPEGSASRRHILQHLAATRFMIICQLPSSDMEEDGFDANSEFVLYFVEHCGGMVQADGEGFYSGSRMIVPLK